MNTNTLHLDDFDSESQRLFQGMTFLDWNAIDFEGRQNGFNQVKTNKSFDEISNGYALNCPFEKESLFFAPPDGSFIDYAIDRKKLAENLIKNSNNKSILKYDLIHYHLEKNNDFIIDNKTLDVKTEINTLVGEIDFSKKPKFSFLFNLVKQEADFKVYYEFTKFKNSNDYNRYAIILTFKKYIDLEVFLDKTNKELQKSSEDSIKIEFNKAFTKAKGKSEVLDFLYETAPDFVLFERKDIDLYDDLILLSNHRIDNIGTNENNSILNLLNTFKDYNWFKNKVNENPSIVRSLLEKISKNYINALIELFIKIGYRAWDKVELEQVISYSLDTKEEDIDDDNFIDSRVAYWCGYIESEKMYEVGFSLHEYDKSTMPFVTITNTLGNVNTYFPLRIQNNDETVFIPAFIAEYFTNEELKEDKKIILENITALILPEETLAKVKPLLGIKFPKIRFLNHKPSWLPERVIATKPNETVTLIGNYIKDTKQVLKELDYPKSVNFEAKNGEFNLLSVPDEIFEMSPDFFKEYNLPWITEATNRGDDIIVLSDKFDENLLLIDNKATGFGKEIQFMDDLVNKGVYKFLKEEGKYIKIKK